MAIKKVKRIEVIFPPEYKDVVLASLQKVGAVHLDSGSYLKEEDIFLSKELRELEEVIELLSDYEDNNFWKKLVPPLIIIDDERIKNIDRTFLKGKVKEIIAIRRKLIEIQNNIKEFENNRRRFFEIRRLSITWEDLQFENFRTIFIKNLSRKKIIKLKSFLKEKGSLISFKKFFIVIFLKSAVKDLEDFLLRESISQMDIDYLEWEKYPKNSPSQIISILDEKIDKLNRELEILNNTIKKYLPLKSDFMCLYDILINEEYCKELGDDAVSTQYFNIIKGWVIEDKLEGMIKILKSISSRIYLVVREPLKEEVPPTKLENPSWLSPYELVVDMYGMPYYYSIDPTKFIAPFFFLFIGLCISDAGYGLILAILSMYLLKKMQLHKHLKKSFMFLLYASLSTVLCGLCLGGFMGISLPFKIVDLLKSPLPFLLFCFILGAIHVILGMFIKVYTSFKNGNLQEGYLNLSWIILLVSLFLSFIFKNSFLHPLIICAILGIIYFSTPKKNIFIKLGVGLYELYGITKYFSDILSYARLLALGMATGVIGMVVNTFSLLAFKIPGIGIILGLLVFVLGHIFNIFINLLGGFIHTLRLHFVEFFSKFFVIGEKFNTFYWKTKYTLYNNRNTV